MCKLEGLYLCLASTDVDILFISGYDTLYHRCTILGDDEIELSRIDSLELLMAYTYNISIADRRFKGEARHLDKGVAGDARY